MNRQLKRILDLVRRTGDRMVVTDPDGENSYVLMGLEQYEELIDATDHHHHDYDEPDEDDWVGPPAWTPEADGDLIPNDFPVREEPKQDTNELPDDLRKAVEHDLAILDAWRKEKESTPAESLPEQKVSEVEPKDEADEDRFYLEPVE